MSKTRIKVASVLSVKTNEIIYARSILSPNREKRTVGVENASLRI